ncbi:hypothetical protein BDB01DRAFT_716259 [Pilobolus umbonatus]|nr:hypothetical protein BDB01DRAFT_716259 [Pilobolus umbonatus]
MKLACLILILYPLLILGYRPLSNESLKYVSKLSQPDRYQVSSDLFSPLLVERISGSPGNRQVRDYIVQHFHKLGWMVELDTFNDTTPLGEKTFSNIIVTHNPDRPMRVVLAAHYDSMYSPSFKFIGATDSAIPCGILMDIAETLNDLLSNDSTNHREKDKTTQIIFFDGEEAFERWGPTDSIYGARHLANVWEASYLTHPSKTFKNRLDQIELLMLLDLLGAPNPQFPNLYRSTSWLFYKLVNLENRLRKMSLLNMVSSKTGQKMNSYFNPYHEYTYQGQFIQDDHVPFLQRGINVLHMIVSPFPHVWHTAADDASCIDPSVVENLSIIFRCFLAEYLELDPLPHNEL